MSNTLTTCQDFVISTTLNDDTFIGSLSVFLEQAIAGGYLSYAALLAACAGFLTSLSPCVYPLIPITLSVMGTRKYESRIHGFSIAASYVLGMILLYSILGVSFAYAGVLAGGMLQNKYVLVALSLIFILMALSILGVFHIAVPSKLLNKLVQIGGAGYRGAFLMGLVAGIIAAPCTGPVLGFILTLVALEGKIITGAYLTLSYGIGMGLPFLILGTFSSALTHLPKSGWFMHISKTIFAVAMLAAAWYYLQLALPSWIYSQGTIAQSDNKLSWVQIGPSNTDELEKQLLEARSNCQPVILDFYADWCTACKELDLKAFENKEIRALLKNFKRIKVDLTTTTAKLEAITEKYQVFGVPTVLFIQPSGTLVPGIRLTELVSVQILHRFLEQFNLES